MDLPIWAKGASKPKRRHTTRPGQASHNKKHAHCNLLEELSKSFSAEVHSIFSLAESCRHSGKENEATTSRLAEDSLLQLSPSIAEAEYIRSPVACLLKKAQGLD